MFLFLPHVGLLLLHFGIKDAACRRTNKIPDVIKARLGEPLTLDCIYNCSSGFIRGSWEFEKTPECGTCLWSVREKNTSEDMCIVSFKTLNLTLEQTQYNYSCYSMKTDYKGMPRMLERLVSLQIQDTTSGPVIPPKVALSIEVEIYQNQKKLNLSSYSIQVPVGDKLNLECLSTNHLCESQWMRDDANLTDDISGPLIEWNEITEDDEGTYICHTKQLCTSQRISVVVDVIKKDEFEWIRPLAAGALCVAVMLLFLLIYLCYKKRGKDMLDAEDSTTVIYENTRSKNEGMIHRPIVQDSQSDHEVPYADIVISVRGSSIPELTGPHGQTPRDHRLRWREEATGVSHLQVCRSADRLHVHPREVSRKLSTTSEYAVITYATDALN
ncbi:uncharacterized protein LOC113660468 isoform X2 [Tachysurus fulvidraco]|uniref:uncharacterized protein LOC113660468 isoform X2 n=1 Tax=Tachysurus fulvidraco TaxID=1234273 RepID=UPI000F4D5287|nr:uncharacterized protein LOC113660468 isoform X2 [Tachysurus fulvidraco]